MSADGGLLVNARVELANERLEDLLSEALARIPKGIQPIKSVQSVRSRARGPSAGFVGLTTYSLADRYGQRSSSPGGGAKQTITFYRELLDLLSDRATVAVIVHELAHAWLNEHVSPEESKERERETDELVARWGFSEELGALDSEAESM